jgi:hypothetical protein
MDVPYRYDGASFRTTRESWFREAAPQCRVEGVRSALARPYEWLCAEGVNMLQPNYSWQRAPFDWCCERNVAKLFRYQLVMPVSHRI